MGFHLKDNTMKKVITGIVISSMLMIGTAFADWKSDFDKVYVDVGIDDAVELAMKEGTSPLHIMMRGVQKKDLNHANLVKALYCAGALGADIQDAAKIMKVSEQMVTAGYKKSIVECEDAMADSQAFTPVGTGTSFVSVSGTGGGSIIIPASPSGFTQ